MKRPGHDATRRNRKIGTEDQGWKKSNRFRIPDRWIHDTIYYERLVDPVITKRAVHGESLPFVVEPPRGSDIHPCTPDDVAFLLNHLPREAIYNVERISGIVLRQATVKQKHLCPVWGRLAYAADVEDVHGPVIFLESQDPSASWCMERKLSLERQGELERMLQLAPFRELDKKGHWFEWGHLHLRRWLLYHTLIHEVGHWVDYLSKVAVPSGDSHDAWETHADRYWARPKSEREAFAHRFSDEWRDHLVRTGALPFAPLFDEGWLQRDGLDPAWFGSPDDDAGAPIQPRFDPPRGPMQSPT